MHLNRLRKKLKTVADVKLQLAAGTIKNTDVEKLASSKAIDPILLRELFDEFCLRQNRWAKDRLEKIILLNPRCDFFDYVWGTEVNRYRLLMLQNPNIHRNFIDWAMDDIVKSFETRTYWKHYDTVVALLKNKKLPYSVYRELMILVVPAWTSFVEHFATNRKTKLPEVLTLYDLIVNDKDFREGKVSGRELQHVLARLYDENLITVNRERISN